VTPVFTPVSHEQIVADVLAIADSLAATTGDRPA
jgi:hypothetical protein